MERRTLPVLQVENPCSEDWSAMEVRGAHVRHCGLCEKNVHDLTHLNAEERHLWLAARIDQKPCVRFVQRADGTLSEGDCLPWRTRALREVKRRSFVAAARLAGAILTLLAAIGIGRAAGFDFFGLFAEPMMGEAGPVSHEIEHVP